MAIRNWKRTRDDRPVTPSVAPAEPTLLPRLGDLARPVDPDLDTEIDIDLEEQRAARYNEWAERLRDKRKAAQERQRQDQLGASPADTRGPTYWSTDALFAESQRVDDEEQRVRPDPHRVQELLAVLELQGTPSPDAIADAYRRLAKVHHPDRFVQADEATQAAHAVRMREIIDAYTTLKTLELTP